MLNIFKFSLHPWRGLCDLIDRAQRGFDLLEGTEKNWLVVSTPLKNISQWEGLSHIYWKIKNVPNHQPEKMSNMGLSDNIGKGL
jgi:hypothetical protein